MLTLIEARGYRSLRQIHQPLGPFHVLVGPNASGKTTFLDVVAFLGHLVSEGIEAAVRERTANFYDLVWQRTGSNFELAVEARIPEALRQPLARPDFDTVRYEVVVGIDPETQELGLQAERVLLKIGIPPQFRQRDLFPETAGSTGTLMSGRKDPRTANTVINKVPGGNDNFYSETYKETGKGWVPAFKLGPRRSALANLPADESKFPVSTWLKGLLTAGVQQLVLNSLLLRRASPPGQARGFKPDGSNLPWVIADLQKKDPERVREWIAHLQTALPDIEDIRTIERPEDKHRYLLIRYRGGVEIPSWMVSDGTLRMLALTILAYLQDFEGVYLIEEPENGIHPRAIETVFQSLSSVYGAQVLLATHSPVILNIVDAEQVLCFDKTPEGATDVVRGSEHPARDLGLERLQPRRACAGMERQAHPAAGVGEGEGVVAGRRRQAVPAEDSRRRGAADRAQAEILRPVSRSGPVGQRPALHRPGVRQAAPGAEGLVSAVRAPAGAPRIRILRVLPRPTGLRSPTRFPGCPAGPLSQAPPAMLPFRHYLML